MGLIILSHLQTNKLYLTLYELGDKDRVHIVISHLMLNFDNLFNQTQIMYNPIQFIRIQYI